MFGIFNGMEKPNQTLRDEYLVRQVFVQSQEQHLLRLVLRVLRITGQLSQNRTVGMVCDGCARGKSYIHGKFHKKGQKRSHPERLRGLGKWTLDSNSNKNKTQFVKVYSRLGPV